VLAEGAAANEEMLNAKAAMANIIRAAARKTKRSVLLFIIIDLLAYISFRKSRIETLERKDTERLLEEAYLPSSIEED
jgi:hypothetical protein